MVDDGRGAAPAVLLSAVLIVRDEEVDLPGCLEALAGVVDEIVVYDTGSVDRTRQRAVAAGARVVQGICDDDFGRARSAAASHARGEWLLVVDADERVLVAEPDKLRALLAGRAVDAFTVRIDNAGEAGGSPGYMHWGTRLVRRGAVRWAGAVHERAILTAGPAAGQEPASDTMPGHVLSLEHLGYADPERVRRKAERNAALGQADLDALVAGGRAEPGQVAGVLLNLGRSFVAAGRRQDAVDTFEAVRELAAGPQPWAEATDHLARVLLAAGHDDLVLVLTDQLRAAGADGRYCDWLRAQALAQLGHPAEALRLIEGVDELVDPAGRRYDLAPVREVRALLEELLALSTSS